MLERHRAVMDAGRTLLKSGEDRVAMLDPFLLAAQSTGASLELAIRRVTTFTFVVSAIIGTLLVTGLVPRLLGVIVALWLVSAVTARLIAARRRHQHGSVLIDFETGRCEARTLAGEELLAALDTARVVTDRSADEQAPVWILVAIPGRMLRLGRATEEDAERTLAVFRRHHVRVERGHGPN
jgi:hypothetical protein